MDLPSYHRFRGWDSSPNSMVDFPANLVIDTGGQPGDRAPYGKNTRITHWPCSIPPINPSWRFPKSWEYTPIYHPCDFRIFHWNHPSFGILYWWNTPAILKHWTTEPRLVPAPRRGLSWRAGNASRCTENWTPGTCHGEWYQIATWKMVNGPTTVSIIGNK